MGKCDSKMWCLLLHTILIVPEGTQNEIRRWKPPESEVVTNGNFSRNNSFYENFNTLFNQVMTENLSPRNRNIESTKSQRTNSSHSLDIFNSTYNYCNRMCGNFSQKNSSSNNVNTSLNQEIIEMLIRQSRHLKTTGWQSTNSSSNTFNSRYNQCRRICENFNHSRRKRKIHSNMVINTSSNQKIHNDQDLHLGPPRSRVMNSSVTLNIFNSSYRYCNSNTAEDRIIYFRSMKYCGIKTDNVNSNFNAILTYLKIFCKADDNFKQTRNETSIKQMLCFIDFGNGENYTILQHASNNSTSITINIVELLCTSLKTYFRDEKHIVVLLKNPTCSMKPETRISCCIHHLISTWNILDQSKELLHCWMTNTSLIRVFIEISYIISFIALLVIFVTEIVSKKFRSERGNQLLVHFALSIFVVNLLDIYMCFLSNFGVWFRIGSIAYQYFSLVESCWTSIIAYLQYKRYVKVLDVEPKNFMLKLCSIAYCSPIPLVVIKAFYNETQIDYVTYSTFWAPALISLSINTIFLILITRNFICVKHGYIEQKRSLSMEVKVIFFLFFILDFSWCFIILFHLTIQNVFADIFLIIHSMQGFMLLLVFGIMNSHNRLIYKNFIKTNVSRFWKQNAG